MVLRYLLTKLPTPMKKAAYVSDGYCRLGALRDDFLRPNHIIDEAVRRLPKKEQDERHFRILRAVQLDLTHTILPKEQWTPWEANHSYLEPYVDEVEAEEKEKKEWYKNH